MERDSLKENLDALGKVFNHFNGFKAGLKTLNALLGSL